MDIIALTKEIQSFVGTERDGKFGIKTAAAVLAKLKGVEEKSVIDQYEKTGSVDERSEKVIATLQKEAQPYMRALIFAARDEGITVKALSGLRTYEEQEEVFRRGKSKAHGGYSNHNFGIACDFGIFVDGKYIDDEADKGRYSRATMDAQYTMLGSIGRSLGLSWGGDWHSFVDMPHFQYRPKWSVGMSESSMLAELRRRHDENIPYYA